eukprot:Gb_07957 [translate_table: standard]
MENGKVEVNKVDVATQAANATEKDDATTNTQEKCCDQSADPTKESVETEQNSGLTKETTEVQENGYNDNNTSCTDQIHIKESISKETNGEEINVEADDKVRLASPFDPFRHLYSGSVTMDGTCSTTTVKSRSISVTITERGSSAPVVNPGSPGQVH